MKFDKYIVISQTIYFLAFLFNYFFTNHSNQKLLTLSDWHLNFDAIHYFNNQYKYQQNHAFLPFYTSIIQSLKALLGDYTTLLLVVIINKILFILTVKQIYIILKMLSQRQENKIALIGTIAFIFNPSYIFFHVVYTQSIFCYCTFKAIRTCLSNQNRGLAVIYFTIGVALRSNGLFLSLVIGLQILDRFFKNIKINFSKSMIYFAKGSLILVIVTSPFIYHLYMSYQNICALNIHPPEICSQNFPNLYSYVQQKYWNVSLFSYYRLSNLTFILIGLPAVLISVIGSLILYKRQWNLSVKGLYFSFIILVLTTVLLTNIQSSTRFMCGHPFFYYCIGSLGSRWRIIRIWVIFYCFLGIFLFSLGYPWT